jgi:hypothetical protein
MEKSKQDIYHFALTLLALANKAGDDATSHAIESAMASKPPDVLPALKQAYLDCTPRLHQPEFEYPADIGKQVETAIRQIDSATRPKKFWFW